MSEVYIMVGGKSTVQVEDPMQRKAFFCSIRIIETKDARQKKHI